MRMDKSILKAVIHCYTCLLNSRWKKCVNFNGSMNVSDILHHIANLRVALQALKRWKVIVGSIKKNCCVIYLHHG